MASESAESSAKRAKKTAAASDDDEAPLSGAALDAVVRDAVATTDLIDVHTHLFPPRFGSVRFGSVRSRRQPLA